MVIPHTNNPPMDAVNEPALHPTPEKKEVLDAQKAGFSPQKPKKEGVRAQKTAELTELLQRTRAEFENYKKRVEKEKQVAYALGQAHTLTALLSVWDSFEHAMQKSSPEQQKTIEPLARQFKETMAKRGVSPIQSKGQKFDPHLHECLLVENNPSQPDNVITQEIQAGFLFGEIVLRHAKVKINRIMQPEEKSEEQK